MNAARARTAIRVTIGFFFILAGASKIADPSRFLTALFAYDLHLPGVLLRLTAIGLPWLELFCGALLAFNAWDEVARRWILVLTVVFIVATAQAILRGLDISCGCVNVGALGLQRWAEILERPGVAFARNVLMLGALVYAGRKEGSDAVGRH
ncbi:MAG TPA: MauE/DoxX family redox-associated membrane protein [Planctomycetota bacterium]|nr:MauE/DoxX family redox-associated membrane protein [Planctomycetota bacterium]